MTSRDFLHEYVEEVNEHLQELESSLLVLEREGSNREEIGRIFRAAHSIKALQRTWVSKGWPISPMNWKA